MLCTLSLLCQCMPQETTSTEQNIPIPPQSPIELEVSLKISKQRFAINEVIDLKFILQNPHTENISFFTMQSPADSTYMGNCFVIKNQKGQLMPYIGTSKPSSYQEQKITVPAGSLKIYSLRLDSLYQLHQAGSYVIQFQGNANNLLPHSTPLTFTIE